MSIGIDISTEKKFQQQHEHEVVVMNTRESDEQITLSSSEFDQFKDDNTPTTVTSELSQAVQLREQLKLFRIYDKKFINVNDKTITGAISYFFKLCMLDAKPRRKRSIKFIPLLLGVALMSAAWFTYSLKQTGLALLASPYAYSAIVVFAAAGLILLVYVVKEYRNTLVYYSQHGQIPVVELLYNIPNKTEFQRFVSELNNCINIEQSKTYYSKSQLLAAELSEHRKLRDTGGLSARGYERAKSNIMKQHK